MADIPRPDGPDVDSGESFLKISWTLYAFAGMILGARLYTQQFITKQLGLGDGLMVLAFCMGVLATIMLTIAHGYGFGRHFFFLTPHERVMASMYTFINEPLGIVSSASGRISFMVLLWRLFGTTKPRKYFLAFMITQTIVINLVTAITIFTQCPNVRTLWDPVGVPGKCWSPNVQTYTGFFQGSCNALTDLILTVLPLFMFYDLQMDIKTKVGLASLLSLSIFAFVAAVIKTVMLQSLGARQDYTFNTVNFFTWINVENTLVIVAASVPFLRPLVKWTIVKTKTRSSPSYELNAYGNRNGSKGYALSSTPGTGSRSNAMFSSKKDRDIEASSEEGILPMKGVDVEKGRGTIVKTTDVQIQYEAEDKDQSKKTGKSWIE